ncbi:excinuclease ABC subunit UvrC [Rarobacter faecitabidus]|uniref:UvrABC system protein C n=1 Tax=Rarobacter faecitabidus TaxID=13243 RepID=A0A542ZVW2_RARFA|nr:excinuclease ABC subunit UvrC [Rarobacter faecitabidus]TQL64505.1 excinuclease ABC subunit C [Rarobacter faecitabidus]
MADPASYRPKQGEIPTSPGVYRFRDEDGRVIYVGKAKNLRARLANYFQPLHSLHRRTQQMVTTAASVEWTVVATEVESLALEYQWIKEYDPRFNVKYRDDKSYPYLAVTMWEKFPRAQVTRGAKKPGTRYFGPYAQAWAIRETLDLLLKPFPVRTCSASVFRRAEMQGRPCLLGYIDKCSAPCIGRISADDHRALADDLCDFLAGRASGLIRRITTKMKDAAAELDFETAARLRDNLEAINSAMESNALVLSDGTDADIYEMVRDELEASVQVFYVRGGRVRGQRGWIVEILEPRTDAELVASFIEQAYGEYASDGEGIEKRDAVPPEVLVPELPADQRNLEAWLSALRGARVKIKVPQRGEKAHLAQTVKKNADHALHLHRMRRSGDLTTRSQALSDLQAALGMSQAPLRIECYDVSHTQGNQQMASMVVFEDGLPRKNEYRTYAIRGEDGNGARDDTEAIREVMRRRLARVHEKPEPGEAPSRRFAYPPQLIIVDGGAPQVRAAWEVFEELGVTDIALCGLAKRLEEVWLPDDDYPLILERSSPGLYLMQQLRDEAHRFAIKAHRKRRSQAMTVSALDSVPGVGPARAKALLKEFGSVKKLRAASVEQIAAVPGMGAKSAAAVLASLASQAGTGPGTAADSSDLGGDTSGTSAPGAVTVPESDAKNSSM